MITTRFVFLISSMLCCVGIAHAAENSLTIYGRVNVSIEKSNIESDTSTIPKSANPTISAINGASPGTSDTYVADNSSRFGLRGREHLNDDYNAIFQYETSLNTTALPRDTFLGIESIHWGAFRLGRITTNNYVSWDGRNLNDVNYDAGTTADKLWKGFVRLSSSLAYETLWVNHFKASIQYAMPQNNSHTWALQGDYNQGSLGLGWGYTSSKNNPGAITSFYESTLNGAYNFGFFKLGAMFELFKNTSSDLDNIHYIKTSAKFPMGQNDIILNLGRNTLGNNSTYATNGHGHQYQIAYGHNFSSQTRVYTFIQTYNTDDSIPNNTLRTFGVGLSQSF